MRELPALAHWLLHGFSLPPALHDKRYGVTSFHHPLLVDALHKLSPEAALLNLADAAPFNFNEPEWRGAAEELRRTLLDNDDTRREAEKLLGWPAAAGIVLAVGRGTRRAHGKIGAIIRRGGDGPVARGTWKKSAAGCCSIRHGPTLTALPACGDRRMT